MVNKTSNKKPLKAAWLIMGAGRGSGAFRTILVLAEALKKIGIVSHFYYYDRIYDEPVLPGALVPNLKKIALDHRLRRSLLNPAVKISNEISAMGINPESVRFGWNAHFQEIKQADVVFVTAWSTAHVAHKINKRGKKIYFSQSQEDWCVPRGDIYYMTREGYRLGFDMVTIGRSLCRYMQSEFGARAFYYDFCADLSVYHRDESIKRDDNKIVFLFQPKRADRCVGLGLEALRLVRQARPNVEIVLYGSRIKQNKVTVPFEHKNLGLLSIGEVNRLFNSAPIGLSLSAVNPSRTAFEMMACGMVPVELYGENSVYDFPSDASVLAHPSPEGLANGLLGLLKDKRRRQKMSEAAIKFMARRDQKAIEVPHFLALIEAIMSNKSPKQAIPQKLYKLRETQ